MNKIDTTLANDLIEKIWDIQDRLKAVQTALTSIEYTIAGEVPDDR